MVEGKELVQSHRGVEGKAGLGSRRSLVPVKSMLGAKGQREGE